MLNLRDQNMVSQQNRPINQKVLGSGTPGPFSGYGGLGERSLPAPEHGVAVPLKDPKMTDGTICEINNVPPTRRAILCPLHLLS